MAEIVVTDVPRCSDCGMRVGFCDPERFVGLHTQFKGPEHTVCNREYRLQKCKDQVEYWLNELGATEASVSTSG